MKAITRSKYGGPEVLKITDVPIPEPTAEQVLVSVHYTTVSRTDCGILWGAPFVFRLFIGLRAPRLKITGSDFAGEIVAIGSAVKKYKVGDRVFGFNDEGLQSHAAYLVINENEALAKIPDNTTFQAAAASAEGAHYALNYVLSQKMQADSRVLVNGGTGAIGSASIQLLKSIGAYVVATAPTAHVEKVKLLGADQVIDFQNTDFTQCGQEFNFVLDSVGKSEWRKCKPLLLPGGKYLSSELGPNAENIYLPILTSFRSRQVKFPVPVNRKRSINHMAALLGQGVFHPLIDREYTPEDIAQAFEYVNSGKKIGNVLLNLQRWH